MTVQPVGVLAIVPSVLARVKNGIIVHVGIVMVLDIVVFVMALAKNHKLA